MLDKNKSAYFKEYYENNKNKYLETAICEQCGEKYKKYSQKAHEKSKNI